MILTQITTRNCSKLFESAVTFSKKGRGTKNKIMVLSIASWMKIDRLSLHPHFLLAVFTFREFFCRWPRPEAYQKSTSLIHSSFKLIRTTDIKIHLHQTCLRTKQHNLLKYLTSPWDETPTLFRLTQKHLVQDTIHPRFFINTSLRTPHIWSS